MDETAGTNLTLVQGEGQQKPQEFAKDTRTSIQKRMEPKLSDFKGAIKAAIEAEFTSGNLVKGDSNHERRLSRVMAVVVGRMLFDSGVKLVNIQHGLDPNGSLRADLLEQKVISQPVMQAPPCPWADDSQGVDADTDEDSDEI